MPQNSGKDYKAREVEVAQPVMAGGPVGGNRGGDCVLTLAIRGREDGHNLEWRDDGTANAILTPNGGRAGMGVGAVACFDDPRRFNGPHGGFEHGDVHPTLESTNPKQFASVGSAVRRLTPRECERLQGFPDGYTDIPWRGKDHAPDGPRYKALGNSMAVPCMLWIGQRIQMVDDLCSTAKDVA